MFTTSKLKICSNVLVMLGDRPIQFFDQNDDASIMIEGAYEESLYTYLADGNWRFATKEIKLDQMVEKPLNRWTYIHQLPTDYIRMQKIYPQGTEYLIYEKYKLYSNSTDIQIDYIYKPDESFFPAHFVTAFEYFLASRVAVVITGEQNKANIMQQYFDKFNKQAKNIDARSNPPIKIKTRYNSEYYSW